MSGSAPRTVLGRRDDPDGPHSGPYEDDKGWPTGGSAAGGDRRPAVRNGCLLGPCRGRAGARFRHHGFRSPASNSTRVSAACPSEGVACLSEAQACWLGRRTQPRVEHARAFSLGMPPANSCKGATRGLHAERSVWALGAMELCDHEPGNSSPSLPRPSGIRSRRRRTPAPLHSTFNLQPSTLPIPLWLTAYGLQLMAHCFSPASYG